MNTSAEVKNLFDALVSFQAEIEPIKKSALNPFFKSNYAPLDGLIEETRPILAKHGLGVIQMPAGENGITTRIIHKSGEWIEETFTMKPVNEKPQDKGSAITYGRRYAYAGALGLSTEEDDDGNAASDSPKRKKDEKADKKTMESLEKLIGKMGKKEILDFADKLKVSKVYDAAQKEQLMQLADDRMKSLPDGEPLR